MWRMLLRQPILLGDDTWLTVLLRGALGEEELAKLSQRSRFRRALDAGRPRSGLPRFGHQLRLVVHEPGRLAPYNVFHWSLTHQNAEIDGRLATIAASSWATPAAPMAVAGTFRRADRPCEL